MRIRFSLRAFMLGVVLLASITGFAIQEVRHAVRVQEAEQAVAQAKEAWEVAKPERDLLGNWMWHSRHDLQLNIYYAAWRSPFRLDLGALRKLEQELTRYYRIKNYRDYGER